MAIYGVFPIFGWIELHVTAEWVSEWVTNLPLTICHPLHMCAIGWHKKEQYWLAVHRSITHMYIHISIQNLSCHNGLPSETGVPARYLGWLLLTECMLCWLQFYGFFSTLSVLYLFRLGVYWPLLISFDLILHIWVVFVMFFSPASKKMMCILVSFSVKLGAVVRATLPPTHHATVLQCRLKPCCAYCHLLEQLTWFFIRP